MQSYVHFNAIQFTPPQKKNSNTCGDALLKPRNQKHGERKGSKEGDGALRCKHEVEEQLEEESWGKREEEVGRY